MNPNKALWEKGDFTAIAAFMRQSGEALVGSLGVKVPLRALDLGCGDGTTAVPLARAGADVTVAGRDDAHRFQVMQALGFSDLHEVGSHSLTEVFAGKTFDVVFEATGSPQVVNQALPLLAKGGIFVCVGIHAAPAQIDLITLVRRSLQIRGTYRATRALWDEVIKLLVEAGERVKPMITHRVPLSHALEGFELAHKRVASKVMVIPG